MPQQLICSFIALVLGLAPAGATAAPAGPSDASVARLRVVVRTTGSAATVRFSPGRIVGQRVTSMTPGAVVKPAGESGWSVTPAGRRATTVEFLAVFTERSGAKRVTVSASARRGGRATAVVSNESGRRFEVVRLDTRTKSRSSKALSRAALFGRSDPAMPRADSRRLVLADFYPWYFEKTYSRPILSDVPADPRSTRGNVEDVTSIVRQARDSGINGFVVSWSGGEGTNADAFDLLLRVSERLGTVATIYLPTQRLNKKAGGTPDRAAAKEWLRQALDRSGSPAFLRSGGVPVIFVFWMNLLEPEDWKQVVDELAREGRPVRLVGDGSAGRYANVSWGLHMYDPNRLTPDQLRDWNDSTALNLKLLRAPRPSDKLFVATVSPGFDATRARGADAPPVVERGPNGERYAATWEAALASRAEWVLVTSWNEWFEGTAIEPGVRNGDLALRQTQQYAARFKG